MTRYNWIQNPYGIYIYRDGSQVAEAHTIKDAKWLCAELNELHQQALSRPTQEPVAWIVRAPADTVGIVKSVDSLWDTHDDAVSYAAGCDGVIIPLYAAPTPTQGMVLREQIVAAIQRGSMDGSPDRLADEIMALLSAAPTSPAAPGGMAEREVDKNATRYQFLRHKAAQVGTDMNHWFAMSHEQLDKAIADSNRPAQSAASGGGK